MMKLIIYNDGGIAMHMNALQCVRTESSQIFEMKFENLKCI